MRTLQPTKAAAFEEKLHLRAAAYASIAGAILSGPAVPNLRADIVYTGMVNISVPNNNDGVYINFVTGLTGSTGSLVPGWDFNPFNDTTGLAFYGEATPQGILASALGINAPAIRLNAGDPISSGAQYNQFFTSAINFRTGGLGYVGLRFMNESTGALNYGWALISTTSGDGFPATIVSYAFENTGQGILAGAVPEPSPIVLLGIFAAGAVAVRALRKRGTYRATQQ